MLYVQVEILSGTGLKAMLDMQATKWPMSLQISEPIKPHFKTVQATALQDIKA